MIARDVPTVPDSMNTFIIMSFCVCVCVYACVDMAAGALPLSPQDVVSLKKLVLHNPVRLKPKLMMSHDLTWKNMHRACVAVITFDELCNCYCCG